MAERPHCPACVEDTRGEDGTVLLSSVQTHPQLTLTLRASAAERRVALATLPRCLQSVHFSADPAQLSGLLCSVFRDGLSHYPSSWDSA